MAAAPAPTRLKRGARSTVAAGAPVAGAAAAAAAAASALALLLGDAAPALAQRVVPKIGSICPLGYVDTFNGKCSTLGLMNYTVQPTNGEACPSGWMNVGGGYCRRKI